MKRSKTVLFSGLMLCVAAAARGQTPTPTPTPAQRITLNNRVFLNTADVYDPTYGLLRVGYIKDNVLNFLPLNRPIRNIVMPAPSSKNFAVYSYHSESGISGDVSIPIIGSAHAATNQVVYANMEDISEVFAPKGSDLSTCAIWALVKPDQIPAGSTVIYTDHAVFSKVSAGSADKQEADAKVGIGSYFSVGADAYKQASSDTKVPLISVTGVQFVVADPKTFCKGRSFSAPAKLKFDETSDLPKASSPLTVNAIKKDF